MKTVEQIKIQKEFELKKCDDYLKIISENITKMRVGVYRSLCTQAELHESRAELLDWVLDEGDFKK